MRIGIFFGGPSREREVSFAGGRTVYDSLDRSLFTPVPIFIDSFGHFVLLEWPYLYKGSIRDFYPAAPVAQRTGVPPYIEQIAHGKNATQRVEEAIAPVGKRIHGSELTDYIDFAFLVLHGLRGEDGALQGLLDYVGIPYSGSGVFPSALGINKVRQKKLMEESPFNAVPGIAIQRDQWEDQEERKRLFYKANQELRFPLVIKAATQGSSIGISFLHSNLFGAFEEAIDRSFFTEYLLLNDWQQATEEQRCETVRELADLQSSLGLPVMADDNEMIYEPDSLLAYLDRHFGAGQETIKLQAAFGEPIVLAEEMVQGQEFSCIVVEDEDYQPVALPPTAILKSGELFDYRAKYLPGVSRKETPIKLPDELVQVIRDECERLYTHFGFQVYARIDGFVQEDGSVFLNDPNTTSGMLPSSFFFHQAAEIGLGPTQIITYIIHASLKQRYRNGPSIFPLKIQIKQLEEALKNQAQTGDKPMRIGVLMGGPSFERHISVESGRNVYQKLAALGAYEVVPMFLSGTPEAPELYRIPINLMLKDNADDIRSKLPHFDEAPIVQWIREEAQSLTQRYGKSQYNFSPERVELDRLGETVDFVFLALHGRPGEDGTLQRLLEERGIPYNGSGPESSAMTINKLETARLLREAGLQVADHQAVDRQAWRENPGTVVKQAEERLGFPMIAKPMDDGCSAAVIALHKPEQLRAYAEAVFREEDTAMEEAWLTQLGLTQRDEFPRKERFMLENRISRGEATRFLEITGGLLATPDNEGRLQYEVFEPSEVLASRGVLSLEEKFLAGEGQNITPARFSDNPQEQRRICDHVREELQKAAALAGVYGYCRIDAFVRIYEDGSVEMVFIEINSLPGLTPATALFHQAALNGYKPAELLEAIVQSGLKRYHVPSGPTLA
jgi:D-alanine-D-alanine ligase